MLYFLRGLRKLPRPREDTIQLNEYLQLLPRDLLAHDWIITLDFNCGVIQPPRHWGYGGNLRLRGEFLFEQPRDRFVFVNIVVPLAKRKSFVFGLLALPHGSRVCKGFSEPAPHMPLRLCARSTSRLSLQQIVAPLLEHNRHYIHVWYLMKVLM